jgi:hypothetical protein
MIGGEICTRRLWSLWDMFELKAGAFYNVATRMAETSAWIGATTAASNKDTSRTLFHRDTRLNAPDRVFLDARLKGLREHLDILGVRITALATQEAEAIIATEHATWGTARDRFDEIRNSLRRELTLQTVLVLEPREQSYYAPTQPQFGSEVAEKFKTDATFEIDEAAKCLALGRPTASVFHLMRVMEIAVRAVARCLSIPDPIKPAERNWGFVLGETRKGIEAKWPTTADRISGDGATFESLYASLDAVKNPWRNDTMHAMVPVVWTASGEE